MLIITLIYITVNIFNHLNYTSKKNKFIIHKLSYIKIIILYIINYYFTLPIIILFGNIFSHLYLTLRLTTAFQGQPVIRSISGCPPSQHTLSVILHSSFHLYRQSSSQSVYFFLSLSLNVKVIVMLPNSRHF